MRKEDRIRESYRDIHRFALRLRRYGCTEREAEEITLANSTVIFAKHLLAREVHEPHKVVRTFRQAWESERTDFDWNDLGNSERFVYEHGEDIRFCHGKNRWYTWDGMRWAEDETEMIKERAKATVMSIRAEAESTDNSRLRSHYNRSATNAKLNSMIKVAQSVPQVSVKHDAFDSIDKTQWLLNCKNGTVDLRTGELRPHDRNDLITKVVPVEYDPRAECPTWNQFLHTVTAGNRDLMDFIQRITGYALTGEMLEKCLFFLLGPTDTGKTTFIDEMNHDK